MRATPLGKAVPLPRKGLTKNKGGTDLGRVEKTTPQQAREAALVMAGIAVGKRLGKKTVPAASDVIHALLGDEFIKDHAKELAQKEDAQE